LRSLAVSLRNIHNIHHPQLANSIGLLFVARLLLAKEMKERAEAERKQQELEEQMNRYSTQYENTQQGLPSFRSRSRL